MDTIALWVGRVFLAAGGVAIAAFVVWWPLDYAWKRTHASVAFIEYLWAKRRAKRRGGAK